MILDPDEIWNTKPTKSSSTNQPTTEQVLPDENLAISQPTKTVNMLKSGLMPISYSQLQSYGWAIQSEKRAGINDTDSKYTFVPIDAKISTFEKKILLISILINKPPETNIYMKRLEGRWCWVYLVRKRLGKEEILTKKKIEIRI